MEVAIVSIEAFDPHSDAASKWVWDNSWGDGGAVVVFDDRVVHTCSKATEPMTLAVSENQPCPNACGVRFNPKVWEQTRKIHGI